MDNKKENSKVIIGGFRTDSKTDNPGFSKVWCNQPQNQSNPIKKNLFKLVHQKLTGNKFDYKSFSKFNPDDLK